MVRGRAGDAGLSGNEKAKWSLAEEDARRYVHRAAGSMVSLVESTFGPRGMEKLVRTEDLQGRPEVVRTGDADRLFDAIERGGGFSHPVAALFVDAVDGMQQGLHDGTTTAVLLAGALLEEGFDLVDRGLAPGSVLVGYGMARARAGEVLDELVRPADADDRELVRRVASTTMTGTVDPSARERYAGWIATVVNELAAARDDRWVNTDDAKVLATTGADGGLHRGLILSQPDDADPTGRGVREPLTEATVAVVDGEIDFEETASVLDGGDGVRLRTAEAATAYRSGLEARIERSAAELANAGVDVLVCREALDAGVIGPFESAGIAVNDKATYPKEDVYRLARATGATTVTDLENLSVDRLGRAGRVRRRRVGDEVWTVFEDCPGPVRTLVIEGDTAEDVVRRRTAVEDALETAAVAAVDRQVLPGAGAPAAAVAAALREFAPGVEGREQLAVAAFADALERVPYLLARNAGLDPIDALTRLRSAHAAGGAPSSTGIDLETGTTVDAWEVGVIEPRRVFSQAIETAGSVVEQMLTIDAVLYPNVDLPGYTPRPERE